MRPVLITVSVVDLPRPLAAGSTRRRADCGHDVWVSVASLELLEDTGALLVCTHCAPDPGLADLQPPTPAQRAQLHAAGVSDAEITAVLRSLRTNRPRWWWKR